MDNVRGSAWKKAVVILLVLTMVCVVSVPAAHAAPIVPPKVPAPTHFNIRDFRVQFRGPDVHPLGYCVAQPVRHYNAEIMVRVPATGRYQYVANWHLGKYLSGGRTCYVFWNNINGSCQKTCSGSQGLRAIVERALVSVLVGVGIVVVGRVAIQTAVNMIVAPVLLLPPYPLP
jgi:hypothetical protein